MLKKRAHSTFDVEIIKANCVLSAPDFKPVIFYFLYVQHCQIISNAIEHEFQSDIRQAIKPVSSSDIGMYAGKPDFCDLFIIVKQGWLKDDTLLVN